MSPSGIEATVSLHQGLASPPPSGFLFVLRSLTWAQKLPKRWCWPQVLVWRPRLRRSPFRPGQA